MAFTQMQDKEGNEVSVNNDYVNEYKSKGYTNYGAGSPSAATGYGGGYGGYGTTDQIAGLRDAQVASAAAALDKQRKAALSGLSTERAAIEPQYQKQKMQAGVTARQTARSFDEYMAQRGGNRSGIAGQGALMNNMAYQGQVGSLNQGEVGAIKDNTQRVTDVNNAYESDLAAAKSGAEATYLQNYINQMNADRTFNQSDKQFDANLGLQQAGLTGTYNGQQTLAAKTAALDQEYRLATLKLQQDSQTWTQQFQEQGYNADQAYRMAQLKLQQDQQSLDEKYRYSALAKSGSGGSGGGGGSSAPSTYEKGLSKTSVMSTLNNMANNGASRSELSKEVWANADNLAASGVDVQDILKWVDSTFTWDKNEYGWWNTADKEAEVPQAPAPAPAPAPAVEKKWWNPFD